MMSIHNGDGQATIDNPYNGNGNSNGAAALPPPPPGFIQANDDDDDEDEEVGGHDAPEWSTAKSFTVLFACTILYSIIAEILVDTVDLIMADIQLDEKFLGLTLFALVPNITEFTNAIGFSIHGNIVLRCEYTIYKFRLMEDLSILKKRVIERKRNTFTKINVFFTSYNVFCILVWKSVQHMRYKYAYYKSQPWLHSLYGTIGVKKNWQNIPSALFSLIGM